MACVCLLDATFSLTDEPLSVVFESAGGRTGVNARNRQYSEGLTTILRRLAAVVLFVISALSSGGSNSFDLLAFGLACLAGALIVDELGLGKKRFGKRR